MVDRGITVIVCLGMYDIIVPAFGTIWLGRCARVMSGRRLFLSEILGRLARGEELYIYLFKPPRGGFPVGLRLEGETLMLTESPREATPRRKTYPIDWASLVGYLMAHIYADRNHPLGERRGEFAKEAEVLMLATSGEVPLSTRLFNSSLDIMGCERAFTDRPFRQF